MKFKIISHASMHILHDKIELLTDPWITGSSYWRSWWNYPPVRKKDYQNISPDYIILTHIHWDHFHSPTLKFYGKDKKIIIPYDRYSRTKDDLFRLGFKNIIEIRNKRTLNLDSDLKVETVAPAKTSCVRAIKKSIIIKNLARKKINLIYYF